MKRIFISYAHDDKRYAKQLQAHLGDVHVAGWMDDADIAAGSAIGRSVKEAIQSASVIAVLISPRSVDNQWVQFELGAGEAMGKTIIPILVEGQEVDQLMPDWLKKTRYLDARRRPIREVAHELAENISD